MDESAYTAAAYLHLLNLLKEVGYDFADYRDSWGTVASAKRVVYLRHDIDYSPAWALSFAQINRAARVAGTFFFQIRSPNYNLHSYATLSAIREISALGQHVGLHFSVEKSISDADLVGCILKDFKALQAQVLEAVPVFSWHNPSVFSGLLDRVQDVVVPGLVNTYARPFIERVAYYSESNLRHSLTDLKAIVQRGGPRLQLLFHPFQWLAGGRDMQEVLANTWIHVLREKEQEFLSNHVYRGLFPSGMPEEWLAELARRLTEYKR
jgi:hypothetical protein